MKNEMVKAESVKSEIKSRTATHSGNLSQRYPLFAEGVKKKSESVKSGGSVKSDKSASGSASPSAPQLSPSIYIFQHILFHFLLPDLCEDRTETTEGGLEADIEAAWADPTSKDF